MEASPRPTQKAVAEAAGVHQATVSLALKSHPSIPEATRKRICRIAKEMGYIRDPMLSALAAYRSHLKPSAFHGVIAWLTNSTSDFDWRTSPHYTAYFQGISDSARQHGYQVEEFKISDSQMSAQRVAGILRARNIPGIVICPQPKPYSGMEFPWKDFSVVTIGYSLATPCLHTVVAAFYGYMQQTIQEVRRRGYERLGMVLADCDNQRFDRNVLASYLVDEYLHSKGIPIPPLIENYREAPETLARWLKKYQPEAVITQDWRVFEILKKLGVHPPKDIGFACAGMPAGLRELSGVAEDSLRIGAVAMDWLAAMIQRGERGIPDKRQRILVDGDWEDGKTLARRVTPKKPPRMQKSH